jgi:hypothetical protein
VAFYAALGLIFVRYSLLHELLLSITGTNTYILYLFAIPAAVGVVSSGGIRRTFAARQAKYWLAFVAWLLLAVLFSTWKGDSINYASIYLRTDLPMLFYTAGLALTWKECRLMLVTIGMAGIFNIAVAFLINRSYGGGRVGLDFGVVSNPNDYAGHLLMILPLLLFLVIFPPAFMPLRWLVRLVGIAAVVAGLYSILMTASRGALIALIVGSAYVLWKSSMKVRFAAIFGLPLLGLVLFTAVSDEVRHRLASMTLGSASDTNDNGTPGEAEESGRLRRLLLDQSIAVTFDRPVFGVGPGQFGNYSGEGKALWRGTHNSFTEISSECGIPALLFYLGAVISSFLLLQRTWKQVRGWPQLKEISVACYCLSLAYLMFCVAIFFLNFAYFFYLPAATGLAISISRGAQRELAALNASKQASPGAAPRPIQMASLRVTPAAPALPPRPRAAIRFNRYR